MAEEKFNQTENDLIQILGQQLLFTIEIAEKILHLTTINNHLVEGGIPNGELYESFTVFCPTDRLDLIGLLQSETVLIDWSRPLFMNFTHRAIMDRIEEFYQAMGGSMEKVAGDIYVLDGPPPDEIKLEELQGEDCEVLELREEHAKAIHDLYPANDMESVKVFERLIRALPAYGVFSGGQLAAWMVQSYYGAMFSMQTRPEFRRKGFGIHLAQCLTRSVRNRGYIPFVVIRPENDASLSLYNKLGFKRSYPTVRAILRPASEATGESNGSEAPDNEPETESNEPQQEEQ
nr:uncharacterized protein LOC112210028 [Halyomorpha halys]